MKLCVCARAPFVRKREHRQFACALYTLCNWSDGRTHWIAEALRFTEVACAIRRHGGVA